MRLLLAATLLLALAPAAAYAFTPDEWRRSMAVADRYWPDSSCRGRVQVLIVQDLPEGWLASAVSSTCRVNVDPARVPDPVTLCGVFVHEFGHAAGLPHSDDPSSVMYPILQIAPVCYLEFTPRPAHPHRFRPSRRRLLLQRLASAWHNRKDTP